MRLPLIVVGAGSAGAVIAARVSESSAHEVVLIEAGPDYPDARATAPGDLRDGTRNSTRDHDWRYRYAPNRAHEPSPFPRGRVTGGSSAVNTCIALRGQPYDYDEWAALGAAHWSFAACLPYFRRLERDLDFGGEWHGTDGPLPIRRHTDSELVPFQRAFLEACDRRGFPACRDHNDPTTTGSGPHAMNKVDGVRISTAMAYLDPARGRPNLRILAGAQVVRVLFRGRRAVGVELLRDGRLERVEGSRVVLCAGAIATPGILVRSGIGPRELLARLGVELRVDAPVGRQLLDHPGRGGGHRAARRGGERGASDDPDHAALRPRAAERHAAPAAVVRAAADGAAAAGDRHHGRQAGRRRTARDHERGARFAPADRAGAGRAPGRRGADRRGAAPRAGSRRDAAARPVRPGGLADPRSARPPRPQLAPGRVRLRLPHRAAPRRWATSAIRARWWISTAACAGPRSCSSPTRASSRPCRLRT